MSAIPPNEALVELADILGEEDTKDLVRTFLQDFPNLVKVLQTGDPEAQKRTAHSLKSTARHMGALALSRKMALYEQRLSEPGALALTGDDVMQVVEEFEKSAGPLRAYAKA